MEVRYDHLTRLAEPEAKALFGRAIYERVAEDVRSRRAEWGIGEGGGRVVNPEEILGFLFIAAVVSVWGLGTLLSLVFAVAGATVLFIVGMRHRSVVHLRQAILGRWCPCCGFDLVASPCALPTLANHDADPGPSCCPECGLPWPLVPPRRRLGSVFVGRGAR